ncbi:hypothetical protein CDD80_2126 [Ophiocordyceps camponoti-rufipedis]|uniref:CorA-like transporter domain-containing protein n=1 Tax=Ophiocordyceps camponoti-rufipedis TaxID=2004952 RepID=A0A2C5ZEF1_9HYPO|nr:hypothetical protein CDD80_2126 [Ophiocordyceps camponoti-rufipedis]
MNDVPNDCFVDSLRNPILLIDRTDEASQPIREASFLTEQDVDSYLAAHSTDYTTRFISLYQRNSWRPLQATRPMLSSLAKTHDLGDAFCELVSCFYQRNDDIEEAYSVPLTRSVSGQWIDISYSLRYPEFKEETKQWCIRHSAIYHRFNVDTLQSIFILFSPRPEARAHDLVSNCVRAGEPGLFSLHNAFFSSYLPNWRRYITFCESDFHVISNNVSTADDYLFQVGDKDLRRLYVLENKFRLVTSMLALTQQALADAIALIGRPPLKPPADAVQVLENNERHCVAYSRSADYLLQCTRSAAQVLTAALSLQNQRVARKQNDRIYMLHSAAEKQNSNMLKLNESAVFITTLTLLYAPASFIASFFGMNFFAMDQPNNRIVATSMIWIYVAATLALTIATVAFYYWLSQHDGVLYLRRISEFPKEAGIKFRNRRSHKQDNDVELQAREGSLENPSG